MELFKGQSLLEFTERFKTDLDCEEYLASLKWEDGYCCRKLRGIYSWFSEFNIDRYLAEYSFRINRFNKKFCVFQKKVVLLQRYKKEKGSKELRVPAACPLISDFK